MDLQALNSGTPITKQWLNPVCSTLTAGTINAGPSLSPVVTSQYSQISSVISSNTTLASFTDGAADFIGSLTLPVLPPGAIVKIKAFGKAGIAVNASINYALYIDGKQATTPTGYAAFTNNTVATYVESYISVKPGNTATAFLGATMNGIYPFQADNQVAVPYDSTTTHQIDIFANFSVAAVGNSFNCNGFFVELSNVT